MSDRDEAGFALARSPSHLLHRAQQIAAEHFGEQVGNGGVTLRQFAVLAAASARAGQTQTDLVAATGIDRSTLADMIGRMEDRGLVSRGKAQGDGRAKSVTLTAAGRAALRAAGPRARKADDALLSALPRTAQRDLLNTLQTLCAKFEAADAPAKKTAAVRRAPARSPVRTATAKSLKKKPVRPRKAKK